MYFVVFQKISQEQQSEKSRKIRQSVKTLCVHTKSDYNKAISPTPIKFLKLTCSKTHTAANTEKKESKGMRIHSMF
jgi:hypothetical protein